MAKCRSTTDFSFGSVEMKTIKVSEATGPVLDWLVAKCEGVNAAMRCYVASVMGDEVEVPEELA